MVLGLIGGVGSGKSTVTDLLSGKYGFVILHTDDIAKELERPGRPAWSALVREFGESILAPGGRGGKNSGKNSGENVGESAGENAGERPIDNAALAELIYSDSEALKKVDEIVHPLVWDYVEEKIKQAGAGSDAAGFADADNSDEDIVGAGSVNIAVETALPDERFESFCDEIWYVYADADTRIKRLMASRGYTHEKCLSVIAEQLGEEEFGAFSDYIIDNSGTVGETAERIAELLPDALYAEPLSGESSNEECGVPG